MTNIPPPEEYVWRGRATMELIYLTIARDSAQRATEKEREVEEHPQALHSTEAFLEMQNHAILSAVMSAMALEAFINVQAKDRLPKNIWEAFEKLKLKNKWRVLPYILNCEVWDEGKRPFQDFHDLVKLRNDLVHYKPQYQEVEGTEEELRLEQHLTAKQASRWYNCARQMIISFFDMINEPVPQPIQEESDIRAIYL